MIKKKWKALFWTVGCLAILIAAGLYFLFYSVSATLEPECDNNRIWEIEGYRIVEKKCIGFAGPPYHPVYLYDGSKRIDELTFIPDSTCVIEFKSQLAETLTFDICEKKLK